MKNINWNGGAKKRIKTIYHENGAFGVFCNGERENPLQKKLFQTNDNEEELFLRLYEKEMRLKDEKEVKIKGITEYKKRNENFNSKKRFSSAINVKKT